MKVLKNILTGLFLAVMVVIIIVGSISTVLHFAEESLSQGFGTLLTTLVFFWMLLYTAICAIYAEKNNKDFTFTMTSDFEEE